MPIGACGGSDSSGTPELEMGLDAGGVERLTRFLAQGFRGGTDICGPLERALLRLGDANWQHADLLIASDGEFGATRETAAAAESQATARPAQFSRIAPWKGRTTPIRSGSGPSRSAG